MLYLPRSSYTLKPWKNGLGTTEEIYAYPLGSEDFLFRVSMASLSRSGPFSLFPGIDRSLILLEGKPVRLNAEVVPLLSPVAFAGEEKIEAIIETEGRDLNLMCRRGKVSGKIQVLSHEAGVPDEADRRIIFALCDFMTVGSIELRKYDSCLVERSERKVDIHGEKFLRLDLRFS